MKVDTVECAAIYQLLSTFINIKYYRPVSRILFSPPKAVNLCHLSDARGHPEHLRCLPPLLPSRLLERNNARATHGTRCTWHFNPQGLSLSRIASRNRALLPHVFTFARHSPEDSGRRRAVIFCDTFYAFPLLIAQEQKNSTR